MKRLKSRSVIPPGGFTFIEERTGLEINDFNFNKVVNNLIIHRKYKGLQPTDRNTVANEVDEFNAAKVPSFYAR